MKPKIIYRAEDRCIFYPAICCVDEPIDISRISKVISKKYYHAELQGIKLMAEVDPNREFTLESYIDCIPNSFNFSNSDIMKCSFLANKKDVFQIRMPYAGSDLHKIMKLATYKQSTWNTILIEFQMIFRGVCMMQDRFVSHTDIKPPNITMKGGKLYLIDTGLVVSQYDLPSIRFSSSYIYNPVESILLSTENENNCFVQIDDRMSYVNNVHVVNLFNEIEDNFNFSLVLKFHKEIDDFNNSRIRNGNQVIIQKLDVYGLSMTLLIIANYLYAHDKDIAINLFNFLIKSQILCFNPIKRASAYKAYRAYRNFITFNVLDCSLLQKIITYLFY